MKNKLVTLNIIKYGAILLLGYLMLAAVIPIGDYCSGLIAFKNGLFYGLPLLVLLLVLTGYNLYQYRKNGNKLNFKPRVNFGLQHNSAHLL